jgi:CHAT domain-containing protein/tetratricopeptide (TPR) repeat protein
MRDKRIGLAWLACLLGAALFSSASTVANPSPGVVVESVEPGGGGAKAGLRPGDSLLSWKQGDRAGKFESFFDWSAVVAEEQPRGRLLLVVSGEAGRREVPLPPGPVQATARPVLKGGDLRDFLEGKKLVEEKDLVGGTARWDALARRMESRGAWPDACWLSVRKALAWEGKRAWAKAQDAWRRAVEDSVKVKNPGARYVAMEGRAQNRSSAEEFDGAAKELEELETFARQAFGESLRLARAIHLRGFVAWKQGKLAEAEGHYLRALPLRERLAPESADTAATLNNLGIVYDDRGDLDRSLAFYERSFALKEKLEPGSLSSTMTLNNLGVLSQRRGDFDGAERYFDRALERYRILDPDGPRFASTLNNLGKLYRERGDLPRAEEALRRALALKVKLGPGTQSHSASLLSLGVLCQNRGNLAAAEGYYRAALEIKQKIEPGSVNTALLINNLGLLAQDRMDYPEAEARFRESFALIEKQAPEGPDAALLLSNLGVVVGRMGRWEEAEALHRRAYVLRKAQAPDGLDTADSLINLSWLARERGELEKALEAGTQAWEMQKKTAPGCLHEGSARLNLALVLQQRGDLPGAEVHYRGAADRFGQLAPGSLKEAEANYLLGMVQWDGGHKEAAAVSLFKAIGALEAQRDHLGGSEDAKSGFSKHFVDYYRDLIFLLLELKRDKEAFSVLERSRARGLLAMLSQRDLVLTGDIPPELEKERRDLAARFDRALGDLGKLSAIGDAQALEKARAQVDSIRRQREELVGRIAEASPHLAALRYPEPLDLTKALQALDPGTVLLAYSIGAKRSALFLLGPGTEFQAFALPFGEETLGREVRRFVRLVESREDSRPFAAALSGKLLGPAKAKVARAKRLLISADGPLHTLPFAALADPSSSGRFRYLAQAEPVHTILSTTLYAELVRGRRADREAALAAFGDPVYPPSGDSRSRLRGGQELVPLPGTRTEVEEIGSLFPGHSRILLGPEATEGATKGLGRNTAIVHFACHGLLDGDFPLDSALALSFPEKAGESAENGLLQAWEIFESVRLDADLVTLSACETGLGREMGGEGLVGLTRAFQYAGARSVLASLWKVPDAATAEFMRRFYAQLRAGQTKDEALRRAQAEFLSGPVEIGNGEGKAELLDASHSFYWAGFILAGDWK